MKTKFNVLAVLLLGIISSSALAEGSRFYGAVDLGRSTVKDRCTGNSSFQSCVDSATAIRIAAGYQITPALGVEASYGNYGTLKDSNTFSAISTINTEFKLSGYAIHATGTLPLNSAFAMIGKLGVARTSITGSATITSSFNGIPNPPTAIPVNEVTSTKASFGVGAQYLISEKTALRAQYDDFGFVGDSNSGSKKITLLSAGVVFRF
jgi:opacity protein-like surface antigen